MITQVELKEFLHYEPTTGIFTWLVSPTYSRVKVGDTAGTLQSTGYNYIQIKGRAYKVHRLAWFYVYGVWPKNQIDHINHVRDDNRIDNLREATNMQNRCNTSNNTSGIAGVSWRAQIQVAGKNKHLGYFASLEDAAEARRAAETQYFGVNAL
jgi:hypothetical protein